MENDESQREEIGRDEESIRLKKKHVNTFKIHFVLSTKQKYY